ncbi:MAG: hypothetical protein EOP50_18705 [Sphingobacteriales bacterium]|nr:MAG: hypothetical protein EOP50_18705 [Sphingobacteriales bacterium]
MSTGAQKIALCSPAWAECRSVLAFGAKPDDVPRPLAVRARAHRDFLYRIARIAEPPFKPLVGGLCVLGFYAALGTTRYSGLGIDVIQEALLQPLSFFDPLYKAIATAMTIGSGFKGGEFIPLVFIGTTLGSAMGFFMPASFQLMGALGFSSVFGAAAKTPLACAVMACELFGWRIAPYALASGFIAFLCSGRKSIYPAQTL